MLIIKLKKCWVDGMYSLYIVHMQVQLQIRIDIATLNLKYTHIAN